MADDTHLHFTTISEDDIQFKLVVGHTTKHMKHGRSCVIEIWWPWLKMSHEGTARVRHFQPQVHHISMSTHYRTSSVYCWLWNIFRILNAVIMLLYRWLVRQAQEHSWAHSRPNIRVCCPWSPVPLEPEDNAQRSRTHFYHLMMLLLNLIMFWHM